MIEEEKNALRRADIIACTLNSCYSNQMESVFKNDKIPICIVDEATQCCEITTLIPLMFGVKTLVLVGDSKQLPAIVISQVKQSKNKKNKNKKTFKTNIYL